MKLQTPTPRDNDVPLFFNVETSVGRGGMNSSREDILLVQFMLKKNGEKVPANSPLAKAENEVMKRVPQTGVVDSATIAAIKAFQTAMKRKLPGTVVDGRVSPAQNTSYGSGIFTIAAMNGFIRRHCPAEWPRIQDFGDCPAAVKTKAQEVL